MNGFSGSGFLDSCSDAQVLHWECGIDQSLFSRLIICDSYVHTAYTVLGVLG